MEREDGAAGGVTVRRYRDGDAAALCELFFRSVREVGPAKYDDAQVRAWAHGVPDTTSWGARMRENETFVAMRDDDAALGWIELEADGFGKHGWHVDERETVTQFGVGIQRARMSKTLR